MRGKCVIREGGECVMNEEESAIREGGMCDV
jgi:hypothetical protein